MWIVYGCNEHNVKVVQYGKSDFFSIAKDIMNKLERELTLKTLKTENGEQVCSIVISKQN